jgi:peroxiredoxin
MMTNSKEALIQLMEGNIVEGGERFYRLNQESGETEYSDDKINWKQSDISISTFLRFNNWRVMDYWAKTWHSGMRQLHLCHKIIERKNGKQIMIKDSTTNKVGMEVSNEWEFLNNTSERVAMIYNNHVIDTLSSNHQPQYRQSYEYNFDPDSVKK